jgi:FkbM family methyltransferase
MPMSVKSVALVREAARHMMHRQLDLLMEHCDEADRVLDMLEDEESRTQYLRELVFNRLYFILKDEETVVRWAGNIKAEDWDAILDRTRRMRDAGEFPPLRYPPSSTPKLLTFMYASVFVLEQYRHPEVEVPKGGIFLDCGACCGETSVWAVRQGAGTVYAFEPNPEALPFLRHNIEAHGQGRVEVVPLGLGDVRCRLDMEGRQVANIGSAKMRAGGEGTVQVVTLDEWARERSVVPDFIKMDVEGFETKLIRGGERTITTRRPPMAVSLYHNLWDYWEIPLLLKRMVPEYRFWCRKNAKFAEFILYASV